MKKLSLAMAFALAACSAPAFAGWATNVSFGGLSSLVYTPDSKPAAGRMMFVNLHGCAQKNTDLQKSNWAAVAEKYNAVVVLPNAGNPVLFGCWNYNSVSSDMTKLVSGTKAFLADSKYGIDPAQVYMTGISSGATFAATVGCAYPELYAGVASAAGPTINSSQNSAMSGGSPSVSSTLSYCKGLGKGKESYYNTQLYAQSYGKDPITQGDGVIGAGWIVPNHKVATQLYGLIGASDPTKDIPASLPVAGHTTVTEREYYINDNNGAKRISLIVVPNMGHAWPGGNVATVGSYVSKSFDMGEWMAVNFTANNCRMAANQGKSICGGNGSTTTSTTTTTSQCTNNCNTTTTSTTTTTFSNVVRGYTTKQVQAADTSISGSKERQYSYYVPNSYVPGTASPLYVVLHGCRINDQAMIDTGGWATLAERDKAIVLFPFQNNAASSNDNDGRNPNCWGYWLSPNRDRGTGEPADIVRMVDKMKSKFTVDNNNVHITGISSGGAMTTIALATYPDVFASGVIVEGVGYKETSATYTGTTDCQTVLNYNLGTARSASAQIADMRAEMNESTGVRQVPVMIFHNKKDCTVPIKVGQSIIDTFAGLMAAEGKAIDMTRPTSSQSLSTDGFPYVWNKYGTGPNGQSLLETVILDVSEAQVRSAGVQVITTDIYDPSSNSVVAEDTKKGHFWPGAAARGPWIFNKGPNASLMAADFFKAHPMNGVTTTTGSTTTTTLCVGAGCGETTTTSTTTTTQGGGTLTAGSGTWEKVSTQSVNGLTLANAYVYHPKNPNPEVKAGKRALMLTLHGCSMSATNVINKGYNWETTAEKYGMVVIAPTVPGQNPYGTRRVGYNTCWDWFGENHARNTRDESVLIKFVQDTMADAKYSIDPKQVYASGLSSGGGLVNDLACVAPDIFAGIGSNAGPVFNTYKDANPGYKNPKSATQIANECRAAAGSYAGDFATQLTSLIHDPNDGLVNISHSDGTEVGMKALYGANTSVAFTDSIHSSGAGRQWGDGTTRADGKPQARVSYIKVTNMGHAWPAGAGGSGGGQYVNYTTVNYPEYLTKFLFDNNMRVIQVNPTPTHTTTTTTQTTGTGTTQTTGTQTTTTTTTTTTQGQCWSESVTATCATHYVAKRLNLSQYLSCGSKKGYIATVELYKAGSTWTNKSNCGALAF